jgi:hypothetical protein
LLLNAQYTCVGSERDSFASFFFIVTFNEPRWKLN